MSNNRNYIVTLTLGQINALYDVIGDDQAISDALSSAEPAETVDWIARRECNDEYMAGFHAGVNVMVERMQAGDKWEISAPDDRIFYHYHDVGKALLRARMENSK
jgi:hypothetical protein